MPSSPIIETLLSIGNTCRTKYQIDNFFLKKYADYNPSSQYFDWLMMGNISGVTNVIARRFDFSSSMIGLHKAEDKFIPIDLLSHHTFLHDFGDGWWEPDHEKAVTLLQQSMDQTVEKYIYLGQKTHDLLRSEVKVGLVYWGHSSDSDWLNLLLTIFETYEKKIPVINILEQGHKATLVDGVYTAYVNDSCSPKRGQPTDWEGWDESWYQAFESLNLL